VVARNYIIKIYRHFGKYTKKPSPQKDAFDNIYETHRSRWTKDELSKIGNCNFTNDNISFIVYITKWAEIVKYGKK
jgi:hypothetical protein